MRRVGYEALEALGGSAPLRHLVTRLGLSRAVLDGLVQQRFARYTDRKSTRLNSSHGYISYAVFCLKKKKNKQNTSRVSRESQIDQSVASQCTYYAASS